jgi:hypothetical protein
MIFVLFSISINKSEPTREKERDQKTFRATSHKYLINGIEKRVACQPPIPNIWASQFPAPDPTSPPQIEIDFLFVFDIFPRPLPQFTSWWMDDCQHRWGWVEDPIKGIIIIISQHSLARSQINCFSGRENEKWFCRFSFDPHAHLTPLHPTPCAIKQLSRSKDDDSGCEGKQRQKTIENGDEQSGWGIKMRPENIESIALDKQQHRAVWGTMARGWRSHCVFSSATLIRHRQQIKAKTLSNDDKRRGVERPRQEMRYEKWQIMEGM